jgi:amidohydrolase
LHQIPEVSGEEIETAALITARLGQNAPDEVLTGLGGHGVAAVYNGAEAGPTVLIRCELDALPIQELSDLPYRSARPGNGHLCGHDGHMAIVMGLAMELAQGRPPRGRVVLLFQPAEETGKGAAGVIADSKFASISPDYAFSLHNLPGMAVGTAGLCLGAANCASRGMRITLTGKTSHAAAPQDGISPAGALARLMPGLVALGQAGDLGPDYALVTLTHAELGKATFGIAPGDAEIWVTLRCVSDTRMAQLMQEAEALVAETAAAEGLQHTVDYDDIFLACTNHPEATAVLQSAIEGQGVPLELHDTPQRWSEDFGRFGDAGAKSAMFWLGSGTDQPQLHNPDYDFPDEVIPVGVEIFRSAVEQALGTGERRNA